MEHFKGKHIWIVGASSGIGKALAHDLARRGATLILSARRKEQLEQLNSALGGNHLIYELDVTDADTAKRTANAIQASIPRLDSVIFMAAVYAPAEEDRTNLNLIKHIIDVNLTGAYNIVYSALPILQQQRGGQLALCASVAGYCGLPTGQPYSSTKSALINLAESLRAELDSTIDVKVINPGFVKTRITDKNTFPMPMIITPEKAAQYITKGLQSSRFEIHFPKRFTLFLKFLRMLPYWIYFRIMRLVKP